MKPNEKLLRALPEQAEEYIYTRFNIEAGYKWGSGMPLDQMNRFYNEITQLFSAFGWTIEEASSSNSAPTVRCGSSSLYCHPMELSGPCEKKLYPIISSILEFASTCSLKSIEPLERVYNISDNEYQQALDSLRKDIEQDLMTAFRTNHPMEYTSGYYNKVDNVAMRYRVPTLTSYIGVSSNDIQVKYITQVFHDLIKEGKILCKENENGKKIYRSITGAEQLERARLEASRRSQKEAINRQPATLMPHSRE